MRQSQTDLQHSRRVQSGNACRLSMPRIVNASHLRDFYFLKIYGTDWNHQKNCKG